jgi:retron-type reverse transcriptase
LAEDSLAPALEELTPLHEMAGGLPGVYTFHGKEGLHAVYDQVLKDGLDVDILQNRQLFRKFLAGYNDHFVRMRRKKRIRSRVLTPNNARINTDDKFELRDVRYLDRNKFPFEMDLKITEKMVAIATLKEESPIGLVISNAEIVRNFKVLFQFLWGIAQE